MSKFLESAQLLKKSVANEYHSAENSRSINTIFAVKICDDKDVAFFGYPDQVSVHNDDLEKRIDRGKYISLAWNMRLEKFNIFREKKVQPPLRG
jgi:hypothetical protein